MYVLINLWWYMYIYIYSLVIIFQLFYCRYVGISSYIEMGKRNGNNMNLHWSFSNICKIILITLMGHKIFEIGISSRVLSNICYWLIGTGLGLYIITLVVYGVMIISCGIDAHCYG